MGRVKKNKKVVVGHKKTVIRAISKDLDKQLQRLFKQEKKKNSKTTFIGTTTHVKVMLK